MTRVGTRPTAKPVTKPATRAKKSFRAIGAGLLILVVVLAVSLGWLLSASGSNWLLQTAITRLQLPLTVAPLEVGFGATMSIGNVRYAAAELEVELDAIELVWRPVKLLQGQLWIDLLLIDGLAIELAEPAAEPEPTPLLPLNLAEVPITLELVLLQLDGFRLSQQGQMEPLIKLIDAKLSASAALPQVDIHQLQLQHQWAQLQLGGAIELAQQLPLQLNLDWTLQHPEYGDHQGQGTLAGDLQQLAIEHQLQGPANAQLELQLKQPLDQLSWQATLQLDSLDARWLLPERQNERYRGALSAQGDLIRLQAQGSLEGAPAELGEASVAFTLQADSQTLLLEQVQLRLPASDSTVRVSGWVRDWLAQPEFDLSGDWSNLRYPLDSAAQYSSSVGDFLLSGSLEQFKLRLDAPLQTAYAPELQLTFNGTGTPLGFDQLQLLGRLSESALAQTPEPKANLHGQFSINGKLNWQPHLNWQLAAKAADIDLATFGAVMLDSLKLDPQWAGLVHLDATTQGQYQQQLNADVTLEKLHGELRGEVFEGHAGLRFADNVLQLHQLELLSNQLTLLASGTLGEQLDVNYQLDSKRLDRLLPDLAGQLYAEGRVQGPPSAPIASALVVAQKLEYQDSSVDSLNLQFDIDLSGQQYSQLQLDAEQLRHQQLNWDRFDLNAEGVAKQHQFGLKLQGGAIGIDFAGTGAIDDVLNKASWTGLLTELTLNGEDIGFWALQESVATELSPERSQLSALCLKQQGGDARLCAQADWQPAATTEAELDLQGLPLSFVAPWLPPDIEVAGLLYSTATLSKAPNSAPAFAIDARTEDGSIKLLEQASLTLKQFRFNAKGDQQKVSGQLELAIPEIGATLAGHLKIDQPEQIASGKSPVTGQLELQVAELDITGQLFPELSQVKGHVDGALALSGVLRAPRVAGHLELKNGEMEVPALGTRFESIQIKMDSQAASPEVMTLHGQATSGVGALKLEGQLQLAESQLDLQLSGQNFEAIATDEAKVQVSPELILSLGPEIARLTGQLTIPWARLTPPDLSNAVSVSRDVKILQQQQQSRPIASTFEADLELVLGEDVRAKGYGFEGNLNGKLRLQEDSVRATRASGNIDIEAGKYEIYGQELDVERGRFVYTGGPVDNPGLDLRVLREVDRVKVGAIVGGNLREPNIKLLSESTMPDASVLSYLLLGRSPENTDSSEQSMMGQASLALSISGGNQLTERLSSGLGVDELKIDTDDDNENAALYIGKYLSPKIYVRYGVGLVTSTNSLFLRYTLDDQWQLESQTSAEESGTDLFYTLER